MVSRERPPGSSMGGYVKTPHHAKILLPAYLIAIQTKENRMSQDREPRRRFIRQVLAIMPATTLATGLGVAQSGCSTGTAASNYSPNYFTADEWTFIKAAVDRLIPHDRYGAG